MRPLGIPTVTDRVVQSGAEDGHRTDLRERVCAPELRVPARTWLQRRPAASGRAAAKRARSCGGRGHQGYFDSIPHDKLMALVRERIADGRVLELIEAFLKQGVLEEGIMSWKCLTPAGRRAESSARCWPTSTSTRWTGSCRACGIEMVRYADDMVVLPCDAESAQASAAAHPRVDGGSGLTLHPEKTRIVDMSQAKATSTSWATGSGGPSQGALMRLIRPKSEQKLREALKPHDQTRQRAQPGGHHRADQSKAARLVRLLQAREREELRELDGWVRGRLRAILRKRQAKGEDEARPSPAGPTATLRRSGSSAWKQARERN